MIYRGFEIVNKLYEDEGTKGFYCVIYAAEDKEHKNSIEEFDLEVGSDIQDCSESEFRKASIKFIDENYDDLVNEVIGLSNKQTYEQFCRAIEWISESIGNEEEFYNTLSKVIGLDDKSILQMGYKNLAPYFDQDAYAKMIADYLVENGTNYTLTGNTQIGFQNIVKRFGIDLSKNAEMCNKVQQSLQEYSDVVVKFDVTEQGLDLTFYRSYCPQVSDDAVEEDCEEGLKMQ